jgi:hypothetical protein
VWDVVQLSGMICSACVKDTFQEPDRSQASLKNVWRLPHCSVLFILHGVRPAGAVKCYSIPQCHIGGTKEFYAFDNDKSFSCSHIQSKKMAFIRH